MKKSKSSLSMIPPVVLALIGLSFLLVLILIPRNNTYPDEQLIAPTPEQVSEANTPIPAEQTQEIAERSEDIQAGANEQDEQEQTGGPQESQDPPEETIYAINDINPKLTEMLDEIASEYNCAAVSLVVYDGKLLDYYTYHYGYRDISSQSPVDPETKFRVASLSKLVVVICVMSLVEDGKLDLDADISDYLGFPVRNPNFPDSEISARMLMQHTSSIFDSYSFLTARDRNLESTAKRLLDSGVCYEQWQPGTQHEYSNFGYSLLGLVSEKITGGRFDFLARDVLFDKLDIDAAFLSSRLRDTSNMAAIYDDTHTLSRSVQAQLESGDLREQGSDYNQLPGNLTISIIDYTKILTMLGNDGVFDEVRVLSEESVREIHDANVQGEGFMQGLSSRYQNDRLLPGAGSYWHTGSAWGTFAQYMYVIDNETNRGVVVVTTGAKTGRLENGMVEVCTDLSMRAWHQLRLWNR